DLKSGDAPQTSEVEESKASAKNSKEVNANRSSPENSEQLFPSNEFAVSGGGKPLQGIAHSATGKLAWKIFYALLLLYVVFWIGAWVHVLGNHSRLHSFDDDGGDDERGR
ncbi:hypothetical protein TNIN_206571, partial [Trichonephila inaurata madagascariensis]